jgi:adenylylsulfate kinase
MGAANNHRGVTIWLTGLSEAGKSTITNVLCQALECSGRKVESLDGDIVRTNLSNGLGYTREDRDTNVRRIDFVSNLLTRNGVIVVAAAILPYHDARNEVQGHVGNFLEVYVKCPLELLVQRDTKGLYEKAMRSEIQSFTGVSAPYEEPDNPDVLLETDKETRTGKPRYCADQPPGCRLY